MTPTDSRKTVAIVGGGLAGLAAGCALSDAGFEVTVYERRPYLGGRASSYEHPGTGEVVDNCQHVLLGCCTSLIDLYRRIGVEDRIRWYDRLTFLEPGGRASEIAMSGLPAPMHTAPSFLRARMLSLRDKLAIARAMLALMPALPPDDGRSFLEWLKQHGQTERAIERFWKVILVSALNEDLDRVSVPNAALVFRESFLKSPQAGRMGVPTVPLTELYGRAGDYICARGGHVELRATIEALVPHPRAASFGTGVGQPHNRFDTAVKLCVRDSSGTREVLPDFTIVAVPFDAVLRLLPDTSNARPLRELLGRFETSPITGVHLWFDREITDLEHAVLLDRTIQWMFHKSKIQDRSRLDLGSYVELVISASKSLLNKSRSEIIDLALRELADYFPAVRESKLLKSTVIKEVHATFAPLPGSDSYRPSSETPWPQLFLAGDWTATGWPATMESAVRSGYLAAQALCHNAAIERNFVALDIPATGLMRFF